MSDRTREEPCEQCGHGSVIKRKEQIRFIQWTDRGYLTCCAVVPIGVCNSCEARIWDEAAESIIEEAVRLEYDKLPNTESTS
jgi:hypothetical protein